MAPSRSKGPLLRQFVSNITVDCRSDVLGHIIPLVGGDWSHDGIAEFFNAIQENGYQFIYLSARAIGQSQITRNFLKNIKQSNRELPVGPLLISPDTLLAAFYRFVRTVAQKAIHRSRCCSREVIAKKPEDFKIECLKNIASLFPGKNPFYAGFGNRINVRRLGSSTRDHCRLF